MSWFKTDPKIYQPYIGYPLISAGKKFYPVYAWADASMPCEYFETRAEADVYIEMSKGSL